MSSTLQKSLHSPSYVLVTQSVVSCSVSGDRILERVDISEFEATLAAELIGTALTDGRSATFVGDFVQTFMVPRG